MHQIPEPDWKVLRSLKDVALDRLCRQILDEVRGIVSNEDKTRHERYLELYTHVHERDEDIARAFNGLSRSSALLHLLSMRTMDLITDAELDRFSEETRVWLKRALDF